ncbi:MAG: hypothetical protein KDB90_15940 [Planctomycetes bacterium]|nr:hypothetical protein [Planctomycetota bacterium]
MIEWALESLKQVPLSGLMLVVTCGYLLGRLQWKGISAGPAGGTLGIALLCGYLGLTVESIYGGTKPSLTVGFFGFALFIYSVGFDAGPQFFSSLRAARGWKFVAVGCSVVVFAVALAVASAAVFGFDSSTTAGVLAGGLTSAPTYAAASEEARDAAHLSVSFALTYPFGLVGLVLMIQILPRLTKTDLSKGTLSEEESTDDRGRTRIHRRGAPELTRAFEVCKQDVCGKPLKELDLTHRTGCFISRVHRGEEVLIAGATTELQVGDHLLVVGRLDELQAFEGLIGEEVYDAELRERLPAPRRVHVSSKAVSGKALKDLNLMGRYRCMIQKIERGHEVIEPMAEVVLQRHDVVEVIGQSDAVRAVARELGRFEPSSQTTDIAIYAGGILLGLLLGSIHLRPLGLDFSMGQAGGLLIVGVVLSWARQFSGFTANVPRAARHLVRDLGVLLFVGETGLAAGHALHDGMSFILWQVIVAGALVTMLPVLMSLTLGRFLLKLRPVDVWGSVCGGMTSSAALGAVKRASDSNEPAVSYAAAFAVASVIVTVAGQVVIRFLS